VINEKLFKTDDGAALRFYEEAEQNNFQSERNGRPIFDQVLYVEVITPASRESAPVFICERKYAEECGIPEPERTQYYERFAKQIEAYRAGTSNVDVAGTPLSAWPRMTVAMCATAAAAGIFTIEGMAQVPDANLSKFGPGARALRDQAKAFLDAAAGNAPLEALAAENANLKAEIDRLTAAVAALGAAPQAQEPAPAPHLPRRLPRPPHLPRRLPRPLRPLLRAARGPALAAVTSSRGNGSAEPEPHTFRYRCSTRHCHYWRPNLSAYPRCFHVRRPAVP
jgi:hypothetical protein